MAKQLFVPVRASACWRLVSCFTIAWPPTECFRQASFMADASHTGWLPHDSAKAQTSSSVALLAASADCGGRSGSCVQFPTLLVGVTT